MRGILLTTLLDVPSFSYLIRWTHVAAMAGLFGGAILVFGLSLQARFQNGREHDGVLLAVAQTYEWVFWLAIGLLVMTGVGNLGSIGAAVPVRETTWGGKLVIKLVGVGAFTLLSLARTLLVVMLGVATERETNAQRAMLGWAYVISVALAAAIVAVAVSLAHG